MQKPLKVTTEVYAKVKAMSDKLNMPMAQCINLAITEWLKKNKD